MTWVQPDFSVQLRVWLLRSSQLVSPPLFEHMFDLTGSNDSIFASFGLQAIIMPILKPIMRLNPRDYSIDGAWVQFCV